MLIDGRPVRPSLGADGALVLPLERGASVGGRPSPATLQVILETPAAAPRGWGRVRLELPRVSLPAASLAWSFYLPYGFRYLDPTGAGASEPLQGHAAWRQPRGAAAATDAPPAEPSLGADAGAVPVRIKLPWSGERREHQRYWVAEGERVAISLGYLDSRLVLPAVALGVLVLGVGLATAASRRRRAAVRALGGALALAAAGLAWWLGAPAVLVLGIPVALALLAWRGRWPQRARDAIRGWIQALPQRWRERPIAAPLTARRRLRQVLLGLAIAGSSAALFVSLLRVIELVITAPVR